MSFIRRLLGRIDTQQEQLLNLIEAHTDKQTRKQLQKRVVAGEITLQKRVAAGEVVYAHIPTEPELSEEIKELAYKESYDSYSKNAYEEITKLIAPNILGMRAIKQAAALQLFCKERIHILLLGDPGTGKTDILSSSNQLAEISSMGLGSGTTGAGLSVSYTKDGLQKGLLVQANNGICCIDELNLMKKEDQAALYNAMEKGFVSYDKAGRNEKHDANVRILATANPKGDQFEGENTQQLRKQLPFEAALISRFHLVFIIRKPDKKQFLDITKKIVKNQKKTHASTEYATSYIKHAQKISVDFPNHLEVLVSEAAEKIKDAEEKLLIEVSPRIVNGIIGLSKASARMHLREKVKPEDVRNALELLSASLDITL